MVRGAAAFVRWFYNYGARLSAEKILIVDDEESIREVQASLLDACGYQCTTAANGAEALKLLDSTPFDLIVTDILMPVMDGLALLERLHEREPDLPVVMVTAMHDISAAIGALRTGA